MLKRKMFRDIKKNLSQFITIFLMVMIGIMVYTTMLSYSGAMQKTEDSNILLATFMQAMLQRVDDDVDLTVKVITKDEKKGMSLPLKFLGEGEYEAVIYSDANKKKLNVTTREVNKYDILTYDLLPDSGYVVKLTKKTE